MGDKKYWRDNFILCARSFTLIDGSHTYEIVEIHLPHGAVTLPKAVVLDIRSLELDGHIAWNPCNCAPEEQRTYKKDVKSKLYTEHYPMPLACASARTYKARVAAGVVDGENESGPDLLALRFGGIDLALNVNDLHALQKMNLSNGEHIVVSDCVCGAVQAS